MKAKPKLSTFTIQVPVDQDEFLQEAAQVLCNSKIGVIRLAIARLKNSKFLEEAHRLAVEEANFAEGAGREVAMQG